MTVHITGPPHASLSRGGQSQAVPNAHTFRPWHTRASVSTAEHQRRRDSHRRSQRLKKKLEREWLWLEVEKRRSARGEQCLAQLADAVAMTLSFEFAPLSNEFHETVADDQPEAGTRPQDRDSN
jgi:hypothetical protein